MSVPTALSIYGSRSTANNHLSLGPTELFHGNHGMMAPCICPVSGGKPILVVEQVFQVSTRTIVVYKSHPTPFWERNQLGQRFRSMFELSTFALALDVSRRIVSNQDFKDLDV